MTRSFQELTQLKMGDAPPKVHSKGVPQADHRLSNLGAVQECKVLCVRSRRIQAGALGQRVGVAQPKRIRHGIAARQVAIIGIHTLPRSEHTAGTTQRNRNGE